jgi:hypothetical protein
LGYIFPPQVVVFLFLIPTIFLRTRKTEIANKRVTARAIPVIAPLDSVDLLATLGDALLGAIVGWAWGTEEVLSSGAGVAVRAWSIDALVIDALVDVEVSEAVAKTITLVVDDTTVVMVVAAVGVVREIKPPSVSSRFAWRARSTGWRLRGARMLV